MLMAAAPKAASRRLRGQPVERTAFDQPPFDQTLFDRPHSNRSRIHPVPCSPRPVFAGTGSPGPLFDPEATALTVSDACSPQWRFPQPTAEPDLPILI